MNTQELAAATRKDAPQVAITTFRVKDLKDWQVRVMAAAQRAGGAAERKGSGCLLWNQARRSAWRGTLKYADGVKVVREWLGPGLGALTIIPHRLYFENDSESPSGTPEWMLVGDSKPAQPSPAPRINSCLEWAQRIGAHMPGFDAQPIPIGRIRTGLHEHTRMVFGGGAEGIPGQKVSGLMQRHGPHTVPAGMRLVLAAEDANDPTTTQYQGFLESAFRRAKCDVRISLASYTKIQTRLAGGAARHNPLRTGYCVLMGVIGKKGEPLSAQAGALIDSLQAAQIPFRMFSLENRSLNWSALDQVGSLLMGAGGIPHTLTLPWPAGTEPPYILGVDLGHPKSVRASWVVMSLLDSRGVLIESWRQRQQRDETIGPAALKAGLTWARQAAQQHHGAPAPGFFVIRDGRLHTGEAFEAYRQVLGPQTTLVELIKYDTPEMFIPGKEPRPASAGTEVLPAGSITPLLAPVAPRLANDLARTFKLHLAPRWDGLGLGRDTVAELVTGLSYTPGLGLATHALPGPIYWADGIAAISETNHQFAGQRIVNQVNPTRGDAC